MRKWIYGRCFVEVKVGDIYILHSDRKIYRVKRIDHTMVVLELEDGTRLRLTDIFGLEKGYSKRESKPPQ
ncbi:MAG TPA: hypothetical protein VEK32_05675 [Thermodesulfobacteriota bacterium]|nr:hypothetical protein [Thermodesulfobacteriota bacterium]